MATTVDPLARYWAKRDFSITAEPRGESAPNKESLSFVIQKHAASRLHYDFRLELDGVLVSWAIPKGPSYDPTVKRMAIRVEDHPLSYGSFEGTIPPKQYGAGTVIVWDHGIWEPDGDPREGLAKGKLAFRLYGQKMAGLWELVKIAKGGEKQEPWILFKKRDEFARSKADYDVVTALPDSVITHPLIARDAAAAAGVRTQPDSAVLGRPSSATSAAAATTVALKRAAKSSAQGKSIPPGAVKAALPEKLAPQLATLATSLPAAGQWVYEIKFDGYRLMTRIENGKATLVTRGGIDWSAKLPNLVRELEQLGLNSAWLDGEIVMLGDNDAPDFNALQQSLDQHQSSDAIVYFLFDVPYFEGYDLRKVELVARRQLLKGLLEESGSDHIRFSADFKGDSASILSSACRMNLEGVIAKRSDASYVSGRTESWLKLKCRQRQEFVVCGYTDRSDESPEIGSLMLGVNAPGDGLVSVGSVGTGWSSEEARELKLKLEKFERATTPLTAGVSKSGRWSKYVAGSQRWVEPRLVAEVEFAGWTRNGQIRQASYIGLRTDKPAKAIVRETAKSFSDFVPMSANTAMVGGVKVSHGERVIDPGSGLTKLDLVRYYASITHWILPHLIGRPCSLVRAPTGVTGEIFFQKHGEKTGIPGIKALDASLWPGHEALFEIGTAQALAGAAQMNVIEFHTWNSLARNIDKPDRMIFDLDPGEGTAWQHMQEAAILVRTLLSELGLESWLKTSGGKGLHVVVPLTPRLDYDAVKSFSQAVVQHLARTLPSRIVAQSGPERRIGKVFVDYLRNGKGATTVAAFSARARPGLGVSMPVSWDELAKLKSGDHWTVASARDHLSFETSDPWADYWKKKQSLSAAMNTLGFKPVKTGSSQ